ncbi:hypothetical protein [Streptomyces sp. NRRL B-24484]|uniref:hypothetical protein n=1 Tax=Streptomyces sp. NRRL B-24484 TaxID=1463833 RepID=UPI0004C1D331|nr:hypothetical protein [Streptomyces sp. NRRL B-24484]
MEDRNEPGWSLASAFDRVAALDDLGAAAQVLADLHRSDDGSEENARRRREVHLIVGRLSARLARHPEA